MRARTAFALALLATAPSAPRAQGLPDELTAPGVTVASATGAEALRVNPAGVGLQRADSVRLVHSNVVRGDAALRGESLAWATQLPFDFGLSLGASWQRPERAGAPLGAFGTLELGLGYALRRSLIVGLRGRFFVSGGERVANESGLDLGLLWRPSQHLMAGVVAQNLVGPDAPAQGLARRFAGGVAVRPTGTDALTLGADVVVPWTGEVSARAGLRVGVPWVGYLRAEGSYDFDTEAWRAGAALELAWGRWRLGGGGFVGANDLAGYTATAAWDGDRSPVGIPDGAYSVAVEMDATPGARGMVRLLWRMERLRRDPAVRAVLFVPRDDVGGLAHAEELREAFTRLRRAGKRVACHLTEASASTWYACAAADRVAVDPAGGLRLAGVRTARYFVGPALWSLGVRADFVRIGDYKSAPEMFTREGSTGPARAQEERMLDDSFANLTAGVAASRGLTDDDARAAVTAGPYTAREARERRLVDALQTLESAERATAASAGATAVDYEDHPPRRTRRWATGRAVAVVVVDGDIVDGESSEIPGVGFRRSGDRDVVEALRVAAVDPRVGAIVLRVDSAGGSALASDLIWRAVAAAARRKPVVASFGRIAASGGYYIAAAAREIVADPSSLTGSIGIFYGKADVAGLLANLRVGVELSRRGERADMDSVFRPYTPEERRFLAGKIGEFYNLFLARVAAGRHRTPQEIDAVGEGRIWSGERAREVGLVDRAGGFLTAVERARELAGLDPDDFDLIELPREPGGLLNTVLRMVVREGASPPSVTELVAATPEVRAPLQWLLSVHGGVGRPMAMADWPLVAP